MSSRGPAAPSATAPHACAEPRPSTPNALTHDVAPHALASLSAGTQVAVRGRILSAGADAALLSHDGASATLTGSALPPEFALVRAVGTWDGKTIALASFDVLSGPPPGRCLSDLECYPFVRNGYQKLDRLRARSRVFAHVRAFFETRGFLEVDTPLVVPSPGLDVHLDALPVQAAGTERYLITSPEYQMKRLLAANFGPIFQLAKCFRNDEIGERHQPEFTMLEWYRPFAGVDDVMADTEALVASVACLLSPSSKPVLHTSFGDVDVTPPWRRVTVREAFQRFAGISLDDVLHDNDRYYALLVERVEPALGELGAVMLCDYPIRMASLARARPDDPSVAERFEAYIAGVELCNGFGELTNPEEQRARLLLDQAARRVRGLPVYPVDERFLSALEDGMPDSGGNALGLDRLVMLALGAAHIEDVLAIPASRL